MSPVFSSPVTTVIHCGSHRTALAKFRLRGGRLEGLHHAAEAVSPGANGDDRWLEHTTAALRVLNAGGRRSGPAVVVLPAHLTLLKQIRAPRVAPAKRAKVIRFEAEQAIPHPLDEMTWDCEVSGQREADEDLMLVAARREIVDPLCQAVRAAGFEPCRILPLALVTLAGFRLARPDTTEPVLVLNPGDRSTILLQVHGTRFAARTLALGCESLTGQIEGNAGNPTGVNDAMEAFVAGLVPEINRSTLHFARENDLPGPARVILAGSGSGMATLGELLGARLNMPVESQGAGGAVGPVTEDPTGNAATPAFEDLVGAAALVLKPGQPKLDLLPARFRRQTRLCRSQPALVAAAVLLASATVPPVLHYRGVASVAESQAAALEEALVPARGREARNRANLARLEQLGIWTARLQAVQDARSGWLGFLAALQERLTEVEDVWLEKMKIVSPAPGGQVRVAIAGCMLSRARSGVTAGVDEMVRVKELQAGLAGLPGVTAIEAERFDTSEPGLLRFEFNLVTNPARVP